MKLVFDFIVVYWKELLQALSILVAIVCLIFRKCKIKLVDSAFEQAIQKLPRWILVAESIFSAGSAKKDFVISEALKFIADVSHQDFQVVSLKYEDKLSDALENILSTPTKKGVKSEDKS